jgi:O-antigen/teichoic acid export membrane protein
MKIIKFLQEFVKFIIYRFHFFIFKKPPGEFSERLIKNLFFAFFGIGGATLITFLFNILAVRYLGPIEYGKLNIIVSVGEFFAIPILFGLGIACLRYLGAERENKEKIIGSSFWLVIILALIFLPIFYILFSFFGYLLKIPLSLYYFALFYSLTISLFYLFQSFFQGLEKFKKFSFFQIISAFIFVGSICLYLFYFRNFSFESLFWSNIFRYLFLILVGFFIFKKMFLFFEKKTVKKLLHYGSFQTLSILAGFFSSGTIDNLMINYFLGASAVGLYAAYYIGFSILVGKILNTFSQVFLPMVSTRDKIKDLFKKTLILVKKSIFFVFLGNLFLIWVLFKFYGPSFSFNFLLALLISFSITFYFFKTIFGNILSSRGIEGAKFGPLFAIINGILNVTFNLIFIPLFGLYGAALGNLLTSLITLSFPILVLKKYFL